MTMQIQKYFAINNKLVFQMSSFSKVPRSNCNVGFLKFKANGHLIMTHILYIVVLLEKKNMIQCT